MTQMDQPAHAMSGPMIAAIGRTRWEGLAPAVIGVAGGLALALSGEPWSYNVAAFVSVALLSEALARAQHRPRSTLAAGLAGLAFGTSVNAVALLSLVELLSSFGHFPAPFAWLTAALGWAAQGLPYA